MTSFISRSPILASQKPAWFFVSCSNCRYVAFGRFCLVGIILPAKHLSLFLKTCFVDSGSTRGKIYECIPCSRWAAKAVRHFSEQRRSGSMAVTYVRRFRMEFSFADSPLQDPTLPEGYVWVPWQREFLTRHAKRQIGKLSE